jgi:hypothetical protein
MAESLGLVAQLRERLKDTRAGRCAFRLTCVDPLASDCLLDISSAGVLTTRVLRGREARSLTVDFYDPTTSTIRKVVEYLQQQSGYSVVCERDYEADRRSADLSINQLSCLGTAVAFKHYMFSDAELEQVVRHACTLHNISYTPATVPPAEHEFVLMLANAAALRTQATDASKRQGMDATVADLLAIAEQLELTYRESMRRQARALPVPVPMDQGDPGRGEVVSSSMYRRSLRNGWMSPIGATLPPIPVNLEVSAEDVGDTFVTVHWSKNLEQGFYAYELWRDTRPGVVRPPFVSTLADTPSVQHDIVKQQYTSKLCFKSSGPHNIRDHTGSVSVLTEQAGQTVCRFTDTGCTRDNPRELGVSTAPPLEPDTVYYYKLFVVGINDEVTPSNEVSVRTKRTRPMWSSSPLSVVQGPAGTSVELRGTGFHTGMGVTFGGKPVTPVVASPTRATIVVPAFANPNAVSLRYDLVIFDAETGLIDVLSNGFMLTA